MRVVFAVPDSVQRALEVDQAVAITTDAYPGRTFVGSLSKIAVQADAKTRSFDVEATVDNADGALKVGMVMLIQLDAEKRHETPSAFIPLSAVVRPPGAQAGFAAYTITAEKDGSESAHLRILKLGDLVGNRVATKSGLSVGDRVVVQGATLLSDGQRVTVVP
jgi:RND family efflux transporter MFP subunit